MTSARRVGTNENIQTYGDGTRDFTALMTWEAATDNDLVTAEQSEVLECYDDAVFNDTITLNGSTTSADYFRIVRPAAGQGHDGTPGTGVRFAVTTDATVFTVGEEFSRIHDIVASLSTNSANNRFCFWLATGGNNSALVGCIGHHAVNAGAGAARGIGVSGPTGNVFVIDCLAIDNKTEGFFVNTSGDTYFYNDTSVGNAEGFDAANGDVICKNCLADANTTADFAGTFHANSATNASSDTSAPGTGSRTEQTCTFVDSENDDYHLAANDAGAKDFGTDLSADATFAFDDDIDGDLWGATWSIGMDHPVAQGGLTPGHTYQYRQRAKYRVSYT